MPRDERILNEILHCILNNSLDDLKRIFETRLRKKERTFPPGLACISEADTKLVREYEQVILVAARLEDTAVLKYLLNSGISVNFTGESPSGKTKAKVSPLHVAINNGLANTVSLLIESNADVNKPDHRGRTPLHLAVKRTDCQIVRMLLQRGANVSVLDKTATSCMQIAAKYGHVELVRILLEFNAQMFQKGQQGLSPLHIAASEGHVPLIDLFSRFVDVNIASLCPVTNVEKSPLHLAAERGLYETITFLVNQSNALVDCLDSNKRTSFHCLVSRPHDHKRMRKQEDFDSVAEFFIKKGQPLDFIDSNGDTVLHLAAKNQFHRIAKMLLYAGANKTIKNKQGKTAQDMTPDFDVQMKQILTKFPCCASPVVSTKNINSHQQSPCTPHQVQYPTNINLGSHLNSMMTNSMYHYDNVNVEPTAPSE